MTSELIERVAGAISETRTGNSLSWRHYVVEAQAAIAAMQADAAPVAWQRRLKYPQAPGAIPQWEECSLNEAVGHFEKQPGYEYRPLYAHPPVAGREAVSAEQAAELAKFKALAETLAGALGEIAQPDYGYTDILERGCPPEKHIDYFCSMVTWRQRTAREALTSYKEARDAS